MVQKLLIFQIYRNVPVNTNHRTFPNNFKGEIRTNCNEKCPEDCKNEGEWEIYYKESDDENKMWRKDGTLKLECVGTYYIFDDNMHFS